MPARAPRARRAPHSLRSLDRVAEGVFFAEGPAANWIILAGDGRVALIDSGYPRDLELVEQSLHEVAPGAPLEAIAITHGHSDHIGGVNALLASHPGARALAGSAEIPNVRRDVVHQVGVSDILPHLYKPKFAAWTVHAVRAGGLGDVGVSDPEIAPSSFTLAGHIVRAIDTPGHTPGHTIYEIPGAKAVATGDALVTGHAVSREVGPQSLHPMFHHDVVEADAVAASLTARYAGWTLLPGHGPLG